jgi:HSP20 family protein
MLPAFRASLPVLPLASSTFHGLDSLFHNVFGDDGDRLKPVWVRNAVPISVWQDDNTVYLEAELPGVAEKDLEITVHDGVLTVKGESHEEEGRSYIYNGRTFGRFERAVTLPDQVDSERVEATLANGVLRISLPKVPQAKPRKIALKTS